MNYNELDNLLGKRASRKLANNTYAKRNGGNAITIELHGNPIAHLESDAVTLSSCGWRTHTTKDRIGYFAQVWQEKGEWYVRWHGKDIIFADGIKLHSNGNIEN